MHGVLIQYLAQQYIKVLDMPSTNTRSNTFFAEWIVFASSTLVLGAVFGFMLWSEYTFITQREEQRLVAGGIVAERMISNRLTAINHTLAHLRDNLELEWPECSDKTHSLEGVLKTLVEAMASVRSLSILDKSGEIIASNMDPLIGESSGGRAYFQAVSQNPHPDILYVGPPYKGLLAVRVMNLSRALFGADGEFAGVVTAALDLKDFSTLLDAIRSGLEGWGSLAHRNGDLFVWEPMSKDVTFKNLNQPGTFFSRHLEGGDPGSLFRGVVFANHEPSLISLRSIQPEALHMDQPLVVAVGRNMDMLYASWRLGAFHHAIQFAVLFLFGFAVLFISQHLRRITERKTARVQSELNSVQTELASFFRITPSMLAVADRSGQCRAINPAWEIMMGYRDKDIEGKPYLDLFHPDDRNAVQEALIALRHGESLKGKTVRMRDRNGEYRYLEWFVARDKENIYAAANDVTKRHETESRLQNLAYFDPLTGLPNRSLFLDRFEQALGYGKRNHVHVGLLFIDLDGFKAVNDLHGHEAGDEVLRKAARIFSSGVRQTDTVARMGGDEFVILLSELNDSKDVGLVAQKILDALAEEITLASGATCRIGASIGVSIFPDNGQILDDLLLAADLAMYESKKTGKNKFVFAHELMQEVECTGLPATHVVGVPIMDEQHGRMLSLANTICTSLGKGQEGVEPLFMELQDVTEHHFATEHRIMSESNYPRQREHDIIHARLLAELRAFQAQLNKSGSRFLCAQLRRWVLEHIAGEDMELAAYLQAKGDTSVFIA
jgi:diguanylate cyclase (GGDEF)-like protein/hemerythrin-like metal-binding protein/PAS domain S-box-containing protein